MIYSEIQNTTTILNRPEDIGKTNNATYEEDDAEIKPLIRESRATFFIRKLRLCV